MKNKGHPKGRLRKKEKEALERKKKGDLRRRQLVRARE